MLPADSSDSRSCWRGSERPCWNHSDEDSDSSCWRFSCCCRKYGLWKKVFLLWNNDSVSSWQHTWCGWTCYLAFFLREDSSFYKFGYTTGVKKKKKGTTLLRKSGLCFAGRLETGRSVVCRRRHAWPSYAWPLAGVSATPTVLSGEENVARMSDELSLSCNMQPKINHSSGTEAPSRCRTHLMWFRVQKPSNVQSQQWVQALALQVEMRLVSICKLGRLFVRLVDLFFLHFYLIYCNFFPLVLSVVVVV